MFGKFLIKTKDASFFLVKWLVFFFLCILEQLYKLIFFIILIYKKKFGKNKKFTLKVISVGNLSVGGTGKSVFVQFLIQNIKNRNNSAKNQKSYIGAIVLRGYKGLNEKTGNSFLVSDGKKVFCNSDFSGDEAYMLASNLKIPIGVGKNRDKSCELLKNKINLDYVVLDDAYQNFDVKKDFEVLLLDATKPFENGHCLPAGYLREKDYSRADAIIFTHSDRVDNFYLEKFKKNKLKDFDKQKIFLAKHIPIGLYLENIHKVKIQKLKNKSFLIFAGIGSFKYFYEDIKSLSLNVVDVLKFDDHYHYTKYDLLKIIITAKESKLDGIITTQKDWVKVKSFFKDIDLQKKIQFYVLKVGFKFLNKNDFENFFDLLRCKLRLK
ncbi:tetraacyldisaccharide 4'-kinase [Candidatus Dependentiae bacterium]|nr:tetraacyldisaccharide 4'-kinase [Candidatus Dependentiae bacterium]